MADDALPRPQEDQLPPEVALAWARIDLWRTVAERAWIPVTVLLLAVPLWAGAPIVEAIAGRTTAVVLWWPVIGTSGAIVVVNVVGLARLIRQRQELRRLRKRCKELEDKVRALTGKGPK